MYILGISSLTHSPAAVLLGEKGIIAAMEESKLLRIRECEGIPRTAITSCLAKGGIQQKDVDSIAIASKPLRTWARKAYFRMQQTVKAPIASSYYQTKALGELARDLNNLRILGTFDGKLKAPVLRFDHALCHASSTFYASPFDRALILTLDEEGDGRCGLFAEGAGNEIRELRSARFPNSLGWVYSQVTQLLGFRRHFEEHKMQWLSTTGQPVFCGLFLEMLRNGQQPWPHVNPKFFRRGFAGKVSFSDEFFRRLGTGKPADARVDKQLRADLAASVQQACSVIVVELLELLRQQHGAKSLCLAGGLFLNPLFVADVEKKTAFERIFVQPAAGNEGTALGAGWLAWHHVYKKPRFEPPTRLDWGPSYGNEEIKRVLDNCKASYRWLNSDERKIEEAMRLLLSGKIVAWFQGAAEFGPRALGNRSLLASPWGAYVNENLNDYVKHRESFRPFALSVAEEECARYFYCSPAGCFMATMGSARSEYREIMKGFLLPDGRIRLHLVRRDANPLLWRLLKRFGESSPAPVLVNTSFNLFGEPLVITPRDAVRSYFCSGTDALVIENFLLSKD